MDNTTLTFVTVLIAVAGTEVKHVVAGSRPTVRPVLAGFMLGIGIFLIGLLSENLATKLCALIIVSSLIVNGQAVFETLNPTNKKQ